LNALGTQLVLELRDCNPKLLNDLPYIRASLIEAANEVGAHIVGETFHQFRPQGVTGVLAIAESHICIHTWPEYGYAAVDIFTCGKIIQPHKAAEFLIQRLQAKDYSMTEIPRGMVLQLAGASRTNAPS